MPPMTFALMLAAVIAAAGFTIWLITMAGPTALLIALPAFMIATVALRLMRR